MNLNLSVLPGEFAICRLEPRAAIPGWASAAGFFIAITRTEDELSIVCSETKVPGDVKSDRGWRCLKVEGPLDLSLTGILASLLRPLAEARINIFAISTYDTDYVLVKEEKLAQAKEALLQSGCRLAGG
jgi:uncharacterized protein